MIVRIFSAEEFDMGVAWRPVRSSMQSAAIRRRRRSGRQDSRDRPIQRTCPLPFLPARFETVHRRPTACQPFITRKLTGTISAA
ncbi:MAG TPA: hypothetical protein PK793_10770, partial [Syntrophales bacterium]|nr:hypothetical protein [Syntrophales bacterium]